MNDEIALWPTHRQAAALRAGEFSSRELLELLITRIERINPDLNAVITFDFEAARQAADEADATLARGDEVGPLHGVSITVKDALETRGLRSTGGAVELQHYVPDRDAPAVRAVKDAGAIVFGKTNLPRWSGDAQAFNEMFGATMNPWDLGRVPGGSSGGAAAAVAAGLTSFEIGTDIAGSVRLPSAFCGVFGHKPSFGIVPSTGYLDRENGGTTEADMNVIGPITRSAEDLKFLLELLVRRDGPLIANLAPAPEDVSTLRVAAWLDDPFCRVDQEVLDVITAAVDRLEASGVFVDRSTRPDIDPHEVTVLGKWLLGAATLRLEPEAVQGAHSPTTRRAWLGTNSETTHREWLAAQITREAIRVKWAEFFECFDAVLMPVTFVPPFVHNHEGNFSTRTLICNGEARRYADIVGWTILSGMAYLPATVPPIGLGPSGLPIGIQVVGPYGADYRTIRLAGLIAEQNGGFQPPPIA
jgi:amidase